MKKHNIENWILGGIVGTTVLSGILLSFPHASADDGAISNVAIRVNSACSIAVSPEGSNDTPHTADLNPGTYQANIGKTTIKTTCNDSNGFSIYAIGYTDEEYGNTVLKPDTVDSSNSIITGTATGANSGIVTSNWAMKISAVSGDYAPTIEEDTDGSYSSFHVIPDDYTKVASQNSVTDTTVGSSLEITYSAYISGAQPADQYNGKVKFVMVHPNNATAPVKPEAPISQCTTKVPNITYMQDITSSNLSTVLSNMEMNQQYYLRDKRDEKPYCVSKLNDGSKTGTIWMTQNLRVTGTVSSQDSNFSTYDSVNVCEGDLTAGNSYDEPRCHDSGNTSNGVWYNYASASAKTVLTDSDTTEATEDICPANWHLPNRDTDKPAGSIDSLAGPPLTTITAFSPVTGGRYRGGSINYTGSGYWWSTTARSSTDRYGLNYGGSSLSTNYDYRNNGYYIRCVR